jgi:hypothetical protein
LAIVALGFLAPIWIVIVIWAVAIGWLLLTAFQEIKIHIEAQFIIHFCSLIIAELA